MKNQKSHFGYNSIQRSGILFLISLVLLGLGFSYFYEETVESYVTPQEALAVAQLQETVDSLKLVTLEKRKPKIYPFNPNFITDYKGYNLGMSVEEIDRLHRFRETGRWINSVRDFKRVTKVSDSLLKTISPYFKFPDWVTNPKTKKNNSYQRNWKTAEEKMPLNTITLEALQAIEEVTEDAADKIIKHHQKIGGYQMDGQLYDVYGVPTKIKRAILKEYTVKVKPDIEKLDVNTSNASDLSTIPLLNYDVALEILNYRILNEGIKSLDELSKLEGMTDYKLARIRLYLRID